MEDTTAIRTYKDIDRTLLQAIQRLINIIYDDLQAVYQPERLRIVMICNPRGRSAPSSRSIRIGRPGVGKKSLTIGNTLRMNGM